MSISPPAVSVIVPIYNVENWLGTCLDSLLAQSWVDWEALLVIDGSPDGSEKIAREYAASDPRFTVIVTPNGGLGAARNVGLEHARAEWVTFLDSDDELTSRALELLLLAAERGDADLVMSAGDDLHPDGSQSRYWTHRGSLFRSERHGLNVARQPEILSDHVAWAKLHRKSSFTASGLQFPTGVHCEDMVVGARAAMKAARISVVPDVTYLHRRHGEAISADYLRPKTLGDWIEQSSLTLDAIESEGGATTAKHHLGVFLATQWWSRAREKDSISEASLANKFDAFTSDVHQRSRRLAVSLPELNELVLREWGGGWGRADNAGQIGQSLNPLSASLSGSVKGIRERCARLERAFTSGAISRRLAITILRDLVLDEIAALPAPGADDLLGPVRDVSARLLRGRSKLHLVGGRRATLKRILGLRRWDASTLVRERIAAASPIRVENVRTWTTSRDQVLVLQSGQGSAALHWLPPTAADASSRWSPQDGGARIVLRSASPGCSISLGDSDRVVSTQPTRESPARRASKMHPVVVFPAWRTNPYLTMLSLESRSRGRPFTDAHSIAQLEQQVKKKGRPTIVHVHWTSAVAEREDSVEAASSAADRALAVLDYVRATGGKVVWTVHNELPHDARYPAAAAAFHKGLAERADVIHVMSAGTVAAMERQVTLDETRVIRIPHPSYVGVYGPRMARDEARASLGVPEDVRTVLFFGQIRPYKGLNVLLDAAEELSRRSTPVHLLLAGAPHTPEDGTTLLRELKTRGLASTVRLDFVPDDQIPQWFGAADVLALPYRRVLNSGTIPLAATYGVPCVATRSDSLASEYAGESWLRLIDADEEVGSFAQALLDPILTSEAQRSAARSFAMRWQPDQAARSYEEVLSRLDSEPTLG